MSRSPLSAREFFRDPAAYAEASRASGRRLPRFSGGRTRYALVTEPADVWRVLVSDGEAYAPGKWKRRARRFLGDTLNTLHGAEHRERRMLLQPSVRRARVDAFADAIVARAEVAAAAVEAGSRGVLRERLDPLSVAMAGDVLLSRDLGSRAEPLARALAEVMVSVPRLTPPLVVTRQARALREVHEAVDGIVAERRAAGREDPNTAPGDLVGALLASGLSEATVRGELTAFLLAAADEPPSALESAVWLLGCDPDAERRLHAELDAVLGARPLQPSDLAQLPFLTAVLRETLRLFPPARHIDRCPVHPVDVAGERVPRGTNVLVSPLVVHRDGAVHERAGDFVPARWLEGARPPRGAYVPFGAGAHTCIGEPLARWIMSATLAAFTRRWRLVPHPGSAAPLPAGPRLAVTYEPRAT